MRIIPPAPGADEAAVPPSGAAAQPPMDTSEVEGAQEEAPAPAAVDGEDEGSQTQAMENGGNDSDEDGGGRVGHALRDLLDDEGGGCGVELEGAVGGVGC